MSFLRRHEEKIYAVARFMTGTLFACHGMQKLFGAFGGSLGQGGPLMTVAGLIELVGGTAIALGLFTDVAAFITSGMMAVAYFTAHAPQGFWPIQNRGELAVLYCFAFLYFSAHGSGVWSLDRAFHRRSGGFGLPWRTRSAH